MKCANSTGERRPKVCDTPSNPTASERNEWLHQPNTWPPYVVSRSAPERSVLLLLLLFLRFFPFYSSPSATFSSASAFFSFLFPLDSRWPMITLRTPARFSNSINHFWSFSFQVFFHRNYYFPLLSSPSSRPSLLPRVSLRDSKTDRNIEIAVA